MILNKSWGQEGGQATRPPWIRSCYVVIDTENSCWEPNSLLDFAFNSKISSRNWVLTIKFPFYPHRTMTVQFIRRFFFRLFPLKCADLLKCRYFAWCTTNPGAPQSRLQGMKAFAFNPKSFLSQRRSHLASINPSEYLPSQWVHCFCSIFGVRERRSENIRKLLGGRRSAWSHRLCITQCVFI